ncbi:hypothetical protein J3E69DRAFT_69396 [Trichoderma sp. SZMC 28015]
MDCSTVVSFYAQPASPCTNNSHQIVKERLHQYQGIQFFIFFFLEPIFVVRFQRGEIKKLPSRPDPEPGSLSPQTAHCKATCHHADTSFSPARRGAALSHSRPVTCRHWRCIPEPVQCVQAADARSPPLIAGLQWLSEQLNASLLVALAKRRSSEAQNTRNLFGLDPCRLFPPHQHQPSSAKRFDPSTLPGFVRRCVSGRFESLHFASNCVLSRDVRYGQPIAGLVSASIRCCMHP